VTLVGLSGAGFVCSTGPQTWQVPVISEDGKYRGGRADVMVQVNACDEADCVAIGLQTSLRLHR
jgi:hypothetical protein